MCDLDLTLNLVIVALNSKIYFKSYGWSCKDKDVYTGKGYLFRDLGVWHNGVTLIRHKTLAKWSLPENLVRAICRKAQDARCWQFGGRGSVSMQSFVCVKLFLAVIKYFIPQPRILNDTLIRRISKFSRNIIFGIDDIHLLLTLDLIIQYWTPDIFIFYQYYYAVHQYMYFIIWSQVFIDVYQGCGVYIII